MPERTGWFERAPHSLAVLEPGAIAHAVAASLVDQIRDILERRAHAVIAPSAGRTHIETLMVLRRRYFQAVDWSRVICVQMDEYADVGSEDGRSLSAQIESQLVAPLRIGRFIRFNDAAGLLERSLQDYEQEIDALGGIDCAIHGVGVNGHIGFNEPFATPAAHARRVRLARATQTANGVDFSHGITLGLDTLVAARTSIVVLLGAQKRPAAGELLYGSVGPHNPVGHLRLCDRVAIYMDREAAPAGFAGEVRPNNVR